MNIRELLTLLKDYTEYESTPIPAETLNSIFGCLGLTPSAANLQPWEILVITGTEAKQALVHCTLDGLLRDDPDSKANWILNAPVVLVVCADIKRVKARYGQRGEVFSVGDVSAAIQTLRISAVEQDIKSAYIREFDQEKVRSAFRIPKDVLPIALVTLGYSTQEVEDPPLLNLEQFVRFERWS